LTPARILGKNSQIHRSEALIINQRVLDMNCKHGSVSAVSRVAWLSAALVLSAALLLPGIGTAQVTLTDGGSSATLDLSSSAGMNSWSVNNQNQLNQQWFWYRTDGGVAAPINSIGGLSYITTGNNEVVATYQNTQLKVSIDYFLTGGGVGSGSADLTEGISVFNKSGSTFTANFYEYSSFNLLQSHNNSVQIFGDPVNGYYNAYQTSGSTAIQEAIVSPFANYASAATGSTTLSQLNGTPALNLDGSTLAGPGDVTWAFQWAAAVDPNTSFDIFKDKNLSVQMVPEPCSSAFALLALGMSACGFLRRRRSS
jgi:hypothetical protein